MPRSCLSNGVRATRQLVVLVHRRGPTARRISRDSPSCQATSSVLRAFSSGRHARPSPVLSKEKEKETLVRNSRDTRAIRIISVSDRSRETFKGLRTARFAAETAQREASAGTDLRTRWPMSGHKSRFCLHRSRERERERRRSPARPLDRSSGRLSDLWGVPREKEGRGRDDSPSVIHASRSSEERDANKAHPISGREFRSK